MPRLLSSPQPDHGLEANAMKLPNGNSTPTPALLARKQRYGVFCYCSVSSNGYDRPGVERPRAPYYQCRPRRSPGSTPRTVMAPAGITTCVVGPPPLQASGASIREPSNKNRPGCSSCTAGDEEIFFLSRTVRRYSYCTYLFQHIFHGHWYHISTRSIPRAAFCDAI